MDPDMKLDLEMKMPKHFSLPPTSSYDDRVNVGEFWTKEVFDYIFAQNMTPSAVRNFLTDSYNASCEAYVINEINKRFL